MNRFFFFCASALLVSVALSSTIPVPVTCEGNCNLTRQVCRLPTQTCNKNFAVCFARCKKAKPFCEGNCKVSLDICKLTPELCKQKFEDCKFACKEERCDVDFDICVGFGSGCDGKCQVACQEDRETCLMVN